MKVPCKYSFIGEDCDVQKVEKIIGLCDKKPVMKTSAPENEENPELNLTAKNEPAIKKIKIDDSPEDDIVTCSESVSWVQCGD